MAEKKAATKATKAASPAATKAVRKPAKKADGEVAVPAKIAAMPAPYRAMGERLHALIPAQRACAPGEAVLRHAGDAKDGPIVCFFRPDKYMTFGLTDTANFTREEGAPHQRLESAWGR